jgi:transposase
MVAAVRRGQPLRAVARMFAVGVATVAHWVARAKGQRLDRVDWSDRSRVPHKTRRTDTPVEDLVLKARTDLAHGDLGAIGADAIRQALLEQGIAKVPSLRTINRILARRGALDGRARTRRPPPPGVGICPLSLLPRPSWIASTSSRVWSLRTAPRSRYSTGCPCTAA